MNQPPVFASAANVAEHQAAGTSPFERAPGGRVPAIAFTAEASETATDRWGANCGPHALAAIMGISLDQVRTAIPGFENRSVGRRYCTPTMIQEALVNLHARFDLKKNLRTTRLCNGINRVQWEGSWLNDGVPPVAAYPHTHWIAHVDGWVLCTRVWPYAWGRIAWWQNSLIQEVKPWHVTHHYALSCFR